MKWRINPNKEHDDMRIPKQLVENPGGGSEFPAGLFTVAIDKAHDSNNEQEWFFSVEGTRKDGTKFTKDRPSIANRSYELGSVQFGAAQPLNDDSPEPHNQKLFLENVVWRDGDVMLAEYDPDIHNGSVGSWLHKAAGYVGSLANALGQVEQDGDAVRVDPEFVSNLRNGKFEGHRVVVKVNHNKRGKPVIEYFGPTS
ncbi:MAG: hypothetical protein R3268_07475 [Acidiferrobacterales bacterium]|nr:hypothetical protein [Acidiferrobacterales bacterium]